MSFRIGLGQDSHAFSTRPKKLVLGGATFDEPGLEGNSDADVVLHSISRALDSVLGTNYLGPYSDKLCGQGIVDSREYVKPALQELEEKKWRIASISLALECAKPKILPKKEAICTSVADVLGIDAERIGLTAESGEKLTNFAKGKGIRCMAIVLIETP